MSLIENKTNKLEGLVRPNIRALQPYSSARDEFETDTDTPGARLVFLDANENSLGGPLGEALHRYSDPHQRELKGIRAVQS